MAMQKLFSASMNYLINSPNILGQDTVVCSSCDKGVPIDEAKLVLKNNLISYVVYCKSCYYDENIPSLTSRSSITRDGTVEDLVFRADYKNLYIQSSFKSSCAICMDELKKYVTVDPIVSDNCDLIPGPLNLCSSCSKFYYTYRSLHPMDTCASCGDKYRISPYSYEARTIQGLLGSFYCPKCIAKIAEPLSSRMKYVQCPECGFESVMDIMRQIPPSDILECPKCSNLILPVNNKSNGINLNISVLNSEGAEDTVKIVLDISHLKDDTSVIDAYAITFEDDYPRKTLLCRYISSTSLMADSINDALNDLYLNYYRYVEDKRGRTKTSFV